MPTERIKEDKQTALDRPKKQIKDLSVRIIGGMLR